MSTPTSLQDVYDLFFSKTDEDFSGKELQIFKWLNSAISKSKKYVQHPLDYVLDTNSIMDGNFISILDNDETELLAIQMKYEYYDKKEAYLLGLRREVGTKDFNVLPNKKQELDGMQNSKRLLKEDIKELRQEFNTYKYN